MNGRLIRVFAWALTASYWMVLFVVTHLPPRNLPQVGVSDKTIHFTCYALLAVGVYACFWLMRLSTLRTALYVTLLLWVYGAVDELLQIPVGRSADLRDWLADASGVLTAVCVMTLVRKVVEKIRGSTGGGNPNDETRMTNETRMTKPE